MIPLSTSEALDLLSNWSSPDQNGRVEARASSYKRIADLIRRLSEKTEPDPETLKRGIIAFK